MCAYVLPSHLYNYWHYFGTLQKSMNGQETDKSGDILNIRTCFFNASSVIPTKIALTPERKHL